MNFKRLKSLIEYLKKHIEKITLYSGIAILIGCNTAIYLIAWDAGLI